MARKDEVRTHTTTFPSSSSPYYYYYYYILLYLLLLLLLLLLLFITRHQGSRMDVVDRTTNPPLTTGQPRPHESVAR